MATEMTSRKIPSNPILDVIREEGLKDPRREYNTEELLEKTTRIHAGWIFDFKYQLLLQKLCRLLDGNYDTHNTPGWGGFGNQLGLTSEILNVIQCSKLGNEGYTYYVLQHYIQKDDATVHKIIDALLNIKRLDVINETHSYFSNLADDVLASQSSINHQECVSTNQNEDSDYFSVSSDSRENGENIADHENLVQRQVPEFIIRSNFTPTPAFILRDLEKQVQLASITSVPTVQEVVHEARQCFSDNRSSENGASITRMKPVSPENNVRENNVPEKKVQKYTCKVLLTFAADGINYANDIAKTIRKEREDGLRIGVLILDEQVKVVENNPELFIAGAFPQVDYVVPIITEGYLKAAMTVKSLVYDEFPCIDCKYVRYIYTLMNKNYVQSGCLNKKVRCVIPDELIHLTHKTLMREPIFETWVKSSSVHKLADRMLARCVRKMNSCTQVIKV